MRLTNSVKMHYAPDEQRQDALRVPALPPDHRVHLDGVVAVGLFEGAEIRPPPPLEHLARNVGGFGGLRLRPGLVAYGLRQVELRQIPRLGAAEVVVEAAHAERYGAGVRGEYVLRALAFGEAVRYQGYRALERLGAAVYPLPGLGCVLGPFRLVVPIGMTAPAADPARAGVAAERAPCQLLARLRLEIGTERVTEEVLAPAAARPAHALAQPAHLAEPRLRADVAGSDHEHSLGVVGPVALYLLGDHLGRAANRPRDPRYPVPSVQATLYREPVVVGEWAPTALGIPHEGLLPVGPSPTGRRKSTNGHGHGSESAFT